MLKNRLVYVYLIDQSKVFVKMYIADLIAIHKSQTAINGITNMSATGNVFHVL